MLRPINQYLGQTASPFRAITTDTLQTVFLFYRTISLLLSALL